MKAVFVKRLDECLFRFMRYYPTCVETWDNSVLSPVQEMSRTAEQRSLNVKRIDFKFDLYDYESLQKAPR